jgi:hypothetical protein
MELPLDPHRVLPIKRLAALLRATSDRAHFSYLLQGCLLVDLCGGAVVGPQQLPAEIEAVWVLLHSVETIVAPIGLSVLRAKEKNLRQHASTIQPDMR